MLSKSRSQIQEESLDPDVEETDPDVDQGVVGGVSEEQFVPSTEGDSPVTEWPQMFESFMQYQWEWDERQEKEAARLDQSCKVLNHQVTQMQLDMERMILQVSERAAERGIEQRMAKLEDSDDIEHYLTTFETLADMHQWPKEDWAVRFIPLLSGKARSAFVAMNPLQTRDYDQVKAAILKKYEINAETYRLRFRSLSMPANETPKELCIRLKDSFYKWVNYEQFNKRDFMETLVLEQYLRVLHPDVRSWVKERNPDTADHAATLVEAYITTRKGPGTTRYDGIHHYSKGKSEGLEVGSNSLRCTKIITSTTTSGSMPQTTAKGESLVCFNCGESGNTRPICPLKKPKKKRLSVPRPESLTTQSDLEPVVTDQPIPALLNTGSSLFLVSLV